MRKTEEFAVFARDHCRIHILPYSQLNALQVKTKFMHLFHYLCSLGFGFFFFSFLVKELTIVRRLIIFKKFFVEFFWGEMVQTGLRVRSIKTVAGVVVYLSTTVIDNF